MEGLGKSLLSTILHIVRDPGSPASKRALGVGFLLILVAYFLLRKNRTNTPERSAIPPPASSVPPVVVKSGFHRIPVRQRVTLVTNDTVFVDDDIRALESEAKGGVSSLSVISSALPSLCEIARCSDLYVITQCGSDATEAAVRDALGHAGVYDAGLNPHKVLFCGTTLGRGSMARQIEPTLHIDTAPEVLETLRPFVPTTVAVKTPQNVQRLAGGAHIVDDIASYFEGAKAAQAQAQ